VAEIGLVVLLFFLGLEFTLAGSRAAAGTPWPGARSSTTGRRRAGSRRIGRPAQGSDHRWDTEL